MPNSKLESSEVYPDQREKTRNSKIKIKTSSKSLMGDLHTAMGIYLKLRDKFRDTILLESADHNVNNNSFSYIAINAIAGVEI